MGGIFIAVFSRVSKSVAAALLGRLIEIGDTADRPREASRVAACPSRFCFAVEWSDNRAREMAISGTASLCEGQKFNSHRLIV